MTLDPSLGSRRCVRLRARVGSADGTCRDMQQGGRGLARGARWRVRAPRRRARFGVLGSRRDGADRRPGRESARTSLLASVRDAAPSPGSPSCIAAEVRWSVRTRSTWCASAWSGGSRPRGSRRLLRRRGASGAARVADVPADLDAPPVEVLHGLSGSVEPRRSRALAAGCRRCPLGGRAVAAFWRIWPGTWSRWRSRS